MTKREARKAWKTANALANCRCATGGRAFLGPDDVREALRFEYWNTPRAGHLIAASMAMDGVDLEDLP